MSARHRRLGAPVRGAPKRPRGASEEDLRAVEAISAFELREGARPPRGWPEAPGKVRRTSLPRGPFEWLGDWLGFLRDHGYHVVVLDGMFTVSVVPAWVNDLADMVTAQTSAPLGALKSPVLGPDHAEAVKLASRAVRAAARSPAFRASLAAEAARLRADVFVPDRFRDLLRWLRDHDWSDCRPGNGDAPPKTGVSRA